MLQSFMPLALGLKMTIGLMWWHRLASMTSLMIRPNRALDNATSHQKKAQHARSIWPEVTVISWDDEAALL
jgi:hypothetical protein